MPERAPQARITRRRMLALLLAPGLALDSTSAQAEWWRFGHEMFRTLLTRPPEFSGLSTAELIEAVHEALVIATHSASETLSRRNGFYGNPDVRIPLPEVLATTRRSLGRLGMEAPLGTLELRMNRAAEGAVWDAREPFIRAIFALDLEDARGILLGGEDAATRHLEQEMRPRLTEAMREPVTASLDAVEALSSYHNLESQMRDIPFLANVRLDLVGHVLEHTMNGLFHAMAEEEARLRIDPVGRGTDVFQRVFARL
ncbi:DUF4197 domain-containing protein [Thioalkalivibrio sp. ALJ16]|uniref:DUF4197 domain-containing protein n=1 Tax=Thioalkalivibrio sp. ALJ16 TaxID=1158762 RepID=UPI0003824AB6|nr:DUF4197 domain-containing protein [Thioalkalivibrio sp. ALJ16]